MVCPYDRVFCSHQKCFLIIWGKCLVYNELQNKETKTHPGYETLCAHIHCMITVIANEKVLARDTPIS